MANLELVLSKTNIFGDIKCNIYLVRDDPKLLNDGGEIPKSQERGWWFDSRL
jgi:hypothetical protein